MSFSPTENRDILQEDSIRSSPPKSKNNTLSTSKTNTVLQEDLRRSCPPMFNAQALEDNPCGPSPRKSVSLTNTKHQTDSDQNQTDSQKSITTTKPKNNIISNKKTKHNLNSKKQVIENPVKQKKPKEHLKDKSQKKILKNRNTQTSNTNVDNSNNNFSIDCKHLAVINEVMQELDKYLHLTCGTKNCIANQICNIQKSGGKLSKINIFKNESQSKLNFSLNSTIPNKHSTSIENTMKSAKLKSYKTIQNLLEIDETEKQTKNTLSINLDLDSRYNDNDNDLLQVFRETIRAKKGEENQKNNIESFMIHFEDNTTSETQSKEQDKFQVNALSVKEIMAINADEKGDGNIHNTRTETIKSNLINLKHIRQANINTYDMLQIMNTRDSIIKADEIKQHISNLEKQIIEEENKLKGIEHLKNEFTEKLRTPILGHNDTFDIESAALSCQKFSEIGGQTNNTLEEFWHKLIDFSEFNSLSETAIKKLLSYMLVGPAFEVYLDNKDKSLKEIAQILTDRFGEILTLSDKLKALNEIKRNPGEKLSSIMARCSALVDATKHSVPKEQRDIRYDLLMRNKLLKLCSEKAKKEIIMERSRAARAGYNLPYKSIYLQALAVENMENETSYAVKPSTFYQEVNKPEYISIADRRNHAADTDIKDQEFDGPTKDINEDDRTIDFNFYNEEQISEDEQPNYD